MGPPSKTADGLLEVLAGRGRSNGCRGYADWTRPEMNGWLGLLRRHGIQPVHHFLEEGVERYGEQALVSMSVDAVDLARDLAIDVVVIVGNPHSTLDSRDPANPTPRSGRHRQACLGRARRHRRDGPGHCSGNTRQLCEHC